MLGAMRGTAGLFRFNLYDKQGCALLPSESLGTQADVNMAPAPAAAVVGNRQVALRQGNSLSLPLVYGEAFVLARQLDRILGVVSVDVDQSQRAELTTASFQPAALLAGGSLVSSFAIRVSLWRRRMRVDRATEERLHYLAQHDPLTGP